MLASGVSSAGSLEAGSAGAGVPAAFGADVAAPGSVVGMLMTGSGMATEPLVGRAVGGGNVGKERTGVGLATAVGVLPASAPPGDAPDATHPAAAASTASAPSRVKSLLCMAAFHLRRAICANMDITNIS